MFQTILPTQFTQLKKLKRRQQACIKVTASQRLRYLFIGLCCALAIGFYSHTSLAVETIKIGLPQVPGGVLQREFSALFNASLHTESNSGAASASNPTATSLLPSQPSSQWLLTKSYRDYEAGIQTGELTAFFAQAHIGAWAIANRSYRAVAKLQAPLYLRLITQHEQTDVFELSDLQQRPVCSEAEPYLSYQFLLKLYPDATARPSKHIMNPQIGIEKVLAQPCIGVVVNEARLANSAERKQYITLARSERLSQIGLFVRNDTSPELREQLINTLLSRSGQALTTEFNRYFSTPADTFVPAVNSDYPAAWQQWLPIADWPR